MRIAVAKESREGETRVALVPDLVGKLTALGYDVVVDAGAGQAAGFADEDYQAAGAQVATDSLAGADVVVSVQVLDDERIGKLAEGTAIICFLPVNQSHELIDRLRTAGISAFAMELVPRISRAQSMDALSSQAMVAGYRGGVVAAQMLRRFFPLNMTAAGTLQPAQVVVLGAGVAGLQAIATSRRLGAVVSAYDVRAAAAEEIGSVGAKAIDLGLDTLEGAGGYAREMTAERAARQKELLAPYVAAADALITTAAVPGRRAPVLVTREMVEQMKPGSVVIDLAADSGGNVEGSVAGETVQIGEVSVWGGDNVPAQMPGPASTLYAHNIVNLVTLMTRSAVDAGEAAAFAPDFADEIIAGCCLTHAGRIEHKPTREAIDGPDPEPEPVAADADADGAEPRPVSMPAAMPAAPSELDLETVPLVPDEAPLYYLDEPEFEPAAPEMALQQAPSGPPAEATEAPLDLEELPPEAGEETPDAADQPPQEPVGQPPAAEDAEPEAERDTALFDLAGADPDKNADEVEEEESR